MTSWTTICGWTLAVLLANPPSPPARTMTVDGLVRLIEHVDVPAGHEGKLEKILIKEGASVHKGDLLGQIDTTQAQLALKKAEWELQLAGEKAKSEVAINLAKSTKEIAQAEFDRAQAARQAARGSMSNSEFDRLRLDAEKAIHELARVTEEKRFAQLTSHAKTVEVQLARLALEERRIVSPLEGVVVQIYRREGEWVHPGEKVLRMVRIDRLRVEAFVDLQAQLQSLEQAPAKLLVSFPDAPPQIFTGEIIFVHPEADPVNGQIRIWAEIENRDRMLRPGQRGQLTITLKDKDEAKRQLTTAPEKTAEPR